MSTINFFCGYFQRTLLFSLTNLDFSRIVRCTSKHELAIYRALPIILLIRSDQLTMDFLFKAKFHSSSEQMNEICMNGIEGDMKHTVY